MSLFNNESKQICATEFWVKFNNVNYGLPVPHEERDNNQTPADLNQVDGTYHVYRTRVEDHLLNWNDGISVVIRDGEPIPENSEYKYCKHKFTVVVSGLEHNGVSITKNATVEYIAAM